MDKSQSTTPCPVCTELGLAGRIYETGECLHCSCTREGSLSLEAVLKEMITAIEAKERSHDVEQISGPSR